MANRSGARPRPRHSQPSPHPPKKPKMSHHERRQPPKRGWVHPGAWTWKSVIRIWDKGKISNMRKMQKKSSASGDFRSGFRCANVGCPAGIWSTSAAPGVTHAVWYCSRKCQTQHWRGGNHRGHCKVSKVKPKMAAARDARDARRDGGGTSGGTSGGIGAGTVEGLVCRDGCSAAVARWCR